LIKQFNLKRAILAEADISDKPGSTSKMIVKIKNDDGSIKGKYAVFFIKIRLRDKKNPENFVSHHSL
jgi:hypothetical protein